MLVLDGSFVLMVAFWIDYGVKNLKKDGLR